jgi:hypothetical protein
VINDESNECFCRGPGFLRSYFRLLAHPSPSPVSKLSLFSLPVRLRSILLTEGVEGGGCRTRPYDRKKPGPLWKHLILSPVITDQFHNTAVVLAVNSRYKRCALLVHSEWSSARSQGRDSTNPQRRKAAWSAKRQLLSRGCLPPPTQEIQTGMRLVLLCSQRVCLPFQKVETNAGAYVKEANYHSLTRCVYQLMEAKKGRGVLGFGVQRSMCESEVSSLCVHI